MFEWLKKTSRPLIRPVNYQVEEFNGDTLLFTSSYENFGEFNFEHGLIIEDFDNNRIDSLPLYDDGDHGDGSTQDGVWSNYFILHSGVQDYRFGIKVRNLENEKVFYHHDLARYTAPSGIENLDRGINATMILHPNFPNPFSHSTSIQYQLLNPGHVELYISNLLCQKIATLVDDFRLSGKHSIEWNATDYESGIYICTLKANNQQVHQKMNKIR